ncbi:MAG TPA: nucleotidyltransferase family protein [Candidatus Nanoarchaeia archaeon]|nr:nucleotidyltransferase family protein [Candidatus Nanoarchaeia archaeon]
MKCIILAAGYSTRLYPLTLNIPKALIKVNNKHLIDYIIDKVKNIKEIDEIILVSNNKFYNQFLDWNKSNNIKIINDLTNSNEERLGVVREMCFVIEKEKINDDLLVIGGDNLFETDLNKMIQLFKKTNSSVIAAKDLEDPEKLKKKFGTIEIDDNYKIIGFEEKPENPKSSLAGTFIYLFIKNDIKEFKNCVEEKNKPDNAGEFIKYLANKRDVYCYIFKEEWYDIGNYEDLKLIEQKFIN